MNESWLDAIRIRPGDYGDLRGLEWDGDYIHFRNVYLMVYENVLKGDANIWIAELPKNILVGQAFTQYKSIRDDFANGKTHGYIFGFRVKAEYRSKGVGAKILLALEQDLLDNGLCKAVLNVNQDNIAGIRFYERWGYRKVAEEPGRWSYNDHLGLKREVHEPAWRMEKILKHPCEE
jgi:ribosomal protein S18 acetylase RimI-like enzyme